LLPPPAAHGPHHHRPGQPDHTRRGVPRAGMKRIGIVAKTDRAEARAVVERLLAWCEERDLQPFLEKETAALCPEARATAVRKPDLPRPVDLVLVLRGGGTPLSMARPVGDPGPPTPAPHLA